jgi:hypothetical protein
MEITYAKYVMKRMAHEKIVTLLKYIAWVGLTASMIILLKAIILYDSFWINGSILFFSAYTAAHLSEIE